MLYDDVAMADFVFGICTTSSLSIIASSSIFVRVYFPLAAASNPPSRFPLTIQLTIVSLLLRFSTSLVMRLSNGLSSLHKATNILKNRDFLPYWLWKLKNDPPPTSYPYACGLAMPRG
ncbi:hypothetical protein GALMADRAFT_1209816 [Galerina marginata CBS 339.88]|uniref:Uncharacterized protein n=1 Tax=Galerina marginata (strain CBS 339.88) TaxID=685588 RepID=A0A067SHA5_GALM3|nr:hypothetical protein GALMADRAFT_1209816 [Galerina marginata CBS 339.88]